MIVVNNELEMMMKEEIVASFVFVVCLSLQTNSNISCSHFFPGPPPFTFFPIHISLIVLPFDIMSIASIIILV